MVELRNAETSNLGQQSPDLRNRTGRADHDVGYNNDPIAALIGGGNLAKQHVLPSTLQIASNHDLATTRRPGISHSSPRLCPTAVVPTATQVTMISSNAHVQHNAAMTRTTFRHVGRPRGGPCAANRMDQPRFQSKRAWHDEDMHDHVWLDTAVAICNPNGTNSAHNF